MKVCTFACAPSPGTSPCGITYHQWRADKADENDLCLFHFVVQFGDKFAEAVCCCRRAQASMQIITVCGQHPHREHLVPTSSFTQQKIRQAAGRVISLLELVNGLRGV